ncbi:putative bifunctional diguanylate cyclase/phosphodiesterase [Shewanella atlantica]|uniref:Bifunctional diguanylate cyclase/phosphodiesterase n=1 Tax=Shewanella atlantica TaxID=271099 RepID=A0A3S0JYB7_9GAMM|nr:GGDEF domain-containing phosphodiesterase [Shewanella atlantica]RTR31631.1 bifunctional diguanylate cyclase/phosphodiesterase [Shewanella atlantica]
MTSPDTKSIFISLKWKLLIAVMVMLTILGGILGGFTFRQLINQQSYQLASQQNQLAQNLQSSISLTVDQSLLAAQQISLLVNDGSNDDVKFDVGNYQEMLDKRWPDIQLYWELNTIHLMSLSGEVLAHAGNRVDVEDRQWFESSSVSIEPHWRIVCHRECVIQVLVPNLLQGEPHLLFLESGLTDILARFRVNGTFELAVLGPKIVHPVGRNYWARELYSISNKRMSLPRLNKIADNFSWEQIASKGGIYEVNGEYSAIWIFPLAEGANSPAILVINNISDWQAILNEFQESMLGTLLFALVLSGCLVILVAWAPVVSLSRHANLLPLLAEHDFETLKKLSPKSSSLIVDEVDLINTATNQLAERLQNLELEVDEYTSELKRLAMLDTLTGLPNKAMLMHELKKTIACVGRIHDQVALMYLDLDEFKRINDTLGHTQGDELLKIVAVRLNNSVRAMDTVFRQGGDEFLILLRGIRSDQDVRKVIHKIFASLQQPVVLGHHKLIVTTSIGVAYCKSMNVRAEELIKYADLAMYQAKDAGRSNYRVFTEEMLHKANNRLMIEQDIGAAIAEKQLSLFLQPIVALPDSKLKGFEALIRWFHPELGLIMPGDFIPDIEHSEAIIRVGNYVLEEAGAMLSRLRKQGWEDLYMAVNLSAKHYMDPGLIPLVQHILSKYDLPPESLLLEVTEESVIEQVDLALSAMKSLKRLGVRIAIDDFGTGYSSLSYLKQLPFDVLKIDRCFTAGVLEGSADTHIVTTVIELAHNLGRTVVAEGIETPQQCEFLADAECELAQGYLFSKPLEEDKVFGILTQIERDRVWPIEAAPQLGKLGS